MYFKQLLKHYQDQLQKDKGIKKKLRDLGEIQWDNLKLLEVGYSSQESELPLSKKMIDSLKAIGFLDSNGKEHFEGFLTVPLMQESQKITGLYGFNPSTRESKVLYQEAGISGFPFPKVLSAYSDQLYLASDVFDAISIMNLGIKNVTFLRSQDEFFNGQYEAICSHGVKDIILLLQRDENFQEPPSKLKEKLQKDGVNVRVVYPTKPNVHRWSDDVASGLTVEGFKRSVSASTEHQGISDEPSMVHSQDGIEHTFEFKHLTFNLRLKSLVLTPSTKVHLIVHNGVEKLRDTLNLLNDNSRIRFSQKVETRLGVDHKIVMRNLDEIIDWLEEESRNPGPNRVSLTAEEKQLALEFSKRPDLIQQVIRDATNLGYVGEPENVQLLYVAATSRITKDPISVVIKAESGSGKSKGIETVASLIPPEGVLRFTSLSEKSLLNAGNGELNHKFLYIDELGYSTKQIDNCFRQILSSRSLSSGTTGFDYYTGRRTLQENNVDAYVSLASSTTQDLNVENASRMYLPQTNMSREQTRAIHEAQKRRYSLESIDQVDLKEEIIKRHHVFQRILKPYDVIIPFIEHLTFSDKFMRARRDFNLFLNTIAHITLLYQNQREVIQKDGKTLLLSDLQDYEIAYNLAVHALSSTYNELSYDVVQFYENLRLLIRNKANKIQEDVTTVGVVKQEINQAFSISEEKDHKRTQRILNKLVNKGHLTRTGNNRGERARYYLLNDLPLAQVDLSFLTTPEDLRNKVELENYFNPQEVGQPGQVVQV